MDTIGRPDVQDVMRAIPAVPMERIDTSVITSANHKTHCRLYHTPETPEPEVKHPGIPPTPPTAPRLLPPRRRRDSNTGRETLRKHYNTKAGQYNAAIDSLNLKKLPSITVNDDEDVKGEGGEGDDDPITAIQPVAIFTHGRNSTLDGEHIVSFCSGFARHAPILLFQDLRPELQRIHLFRSLVHSYPSINTFSGRSAGARNAARASIHTPVKMLIFFTLPLVRDLDYRYADLIALDQNVEILFIVGDGDPLAVETQLREVRHRMRAKSWWIKLIRGDHEFKSWDKGELEGALDVAVQLAGIWAKSEDLDSDLSEMALQSSHRTGKVEWTSWQPPSPDTPKPAAFFNVEVEGGNMPPGGGRFQFQVPGRGAKWRGNKGKGNRDK